MAEQTFRSPGFFENEIDLTQRVQSPLGTPAGVIGTAQKGPAFVPVTVGSFADFKTKFGGLSSKRFGPYAVNEFLKNRDAVTYVRVLGAGSNDSDGDIETTRSQGSVKNAGFKLVPVAAGNNGPGSAEVVNFIAATHFVSSSEAAGYPIFSENVTYPPVSYDANSNKKYVNLIRAMILTSKDARLCILSGSGNLHGISDLGRTAHDAAFDCNAALGPQNDPMAGKFKLIISSSEDSYGSFTDLTPGTTLVPAKSRTHLGVRVLTASLDPREPDYIRNILNTDPEKFQTEQHLLYGCFDVPASLATVLQNSGATGDAKTGQFDKAHQISSISVLSGSGNVSSNNPAGQAFKSAFGRFDTRYTTPQTTKFISQPYGDQEFDLFHFETIDDGAYANGRFKVSIASVRASDDENNPYGTFSVQIRNYDDSDKSPEILEEYPQCDLNPTSENFIGRKIGNRKAFFNFDASDENERRVIVEGTYPNLSNLVRVVLSDDLVNNNVPRDALPFGFRGLPALNTAMLYLGGRVSGSNAIGGPGVNKSRLGNNGNNASFKAGATISNYTRLASVLPPVDLRFKITNGKVSSNPSYTGQPGVLETLDPRFYWGVKTTRVPADSTLHPTVQGAVSDAALQPNASSEVNLGLKDQLKFLGIQKMDNLYTGSSADEFNNNKFTLARVALYNQAGGNDTAAYADIELTGSVKDIMRETAYLRNGKPLSERTYVIDDPNRPNRITFATLAAQTSSVTFNRFTDFLKFTNVFYGGFDGTNILDKNAARLDDKSVSFDTGGGAASTFTSPGLTTNMAGSGISNSGIMSYKAAVNLMTDPSTVRTNILAIPGIREKFVTDHAMTKNSDYGMSIYLMDLPEFNDAGTRIYAGDGNRADVAKTKTEFERRTVDNNASATYFPNVIIRDDESGANVEVPPSVAGLAALSFNDRVSFPWFAPAGFNRGALSNVSAAAVRLTAGDRDDLYDARINPIATFPNQGPVIFGQKTLQIAKSALDRVNVRRLLLEVKRQVVNVANNFVFEQNTPQLRRRFVAQVSPLLAVIQAQSGIEQFKVIMDESNNSQEDIESNKLNGRIVIVPTRSIEFISLDFIITNAGVSFD